MPLEIAQPMGLSVLAILPLVIYFARRSLVSLSPCRRALALGLQCVLIVLLSLGLSDIRYRDTTHRVWRVFALDWSRSISSTSAKSVASYQVICAAQSSGDVAETLAFAGQPRGLERVLAPGSPRVLKDDFWPPAERQATNIALAIAAARGAIPEGYVPQIILMTDGNQTQGDVVAAAKAAGVPMDVLPLDPARDEVYVSELRTPAAVRPGIDFPISAAVYAMSPCEGVVHLLRDGEEIATQPCKLASGDNAVLFQQSLRVPGDAKYTVKLSGFPDTLLENNEASILVTARSKPRVLLIEGQQGEGSHLAAALAKNQFDVTSQSAADAAANAAVAPFDLVVLVNVPASAMSVARQKELADYVRSGGGLLLVGGDRTFTPGGYKGSTLETILPLQSAVRDKPRPPLALVLVIDTSMSMQGPSIELSRQATRKALQMLDATDEIGLLAFADESHWVIPPVLCRDKAALGKSVDGLTATGRTNMAPALQRAILALGESWIDRRHIVLLTDGLSDPGDFRELSEQALRVGATISTVALGEEAAQDLLKDIAERAKGRFYYCRDAAGVPAIFEMETSSAGNIGITEEAVQPVPEAKKDDSAVFDFKEFPTLTGYAETKAKPESQVLIQTADGQAILASMPVGQGRSAAFASDAQNRWAAAWLRWANFDKFWTQIARNTMRKDDDAVASMRAEKPDFPAELRVQDVNTQLLQAIAKESGGRFAPTEAEVYASSGRTVEREIPLWHWLLTGALVVFLADIAILRTARQP